uniref:Uncharacterized protein n=1 Tax=Peronospora matthiolae TaxID=2874970 RepID=A0AAV1T3U3_9STRA
MARRKCHEEASSTHSVEATTSHQPRHLGPSAYPRVVKSSILQSHAVVAESSRRWSHVLMQYSVILVAGSSRQGRKHHHT